jgi:hypothetical protein
MAGMVEGGVALPNFVLVGAAKAGTTSLYHYLRQHPEVYLPDSYKESRFFASELLTDVLHYKQTSVFTFEDFRALYRGADAYKAIGDFGNAYLLYPDHVIPKLKQYLGDVKIVMVLRDPVERAFSAYQFACRYQHESASFEKALANEEKRVPAYHHPPDIFYYKGYSLYCNKVKTFLEAFSQVHVILAEDLKNQPLDTLANLFRFLKVEDYQPININTQYNEGGWVPANLKVLNALFTGKRAANIAKPVLQHIPPLYWLGEQTLKSLEKLRDRLVVKKNISLKPDTEAFLRQFFESDIQCLEQVLKRDLSHWKKGT